MNDGAPPIPPKLAFALRELGWLKNGELPFLAAQWLVEGFDGPSLRELAGLTRGEVDQIDLRLWREALTDIGVAASDVPVRRTAAPFLARSVLAGELTERRLCEALRPELHADSPSPEPEIDGLVDQWDELLDYREYLAGERSPRRRDRGWLDRLDAQNRRAVEALADGNVEEAVAALTEWSAGT